MRFLKSFLILFIMINLVIVEKGSSQQSTVTGGSERGSAAIGHYARSRALLVEALAEFELGRRLADPGLIIDTEQWRMTLVSRTEELNRILDPKPRVTRSGVRFKANSKLIRQDRVPSIEEYKQMPKDSNVYGENSAPQSYKKPTKQLSTKQVAITSGVKRPKPNTQGAQSKKILEDEVSKVEDSSALNVSESAESIEDAKSKETPENQPEYSEKLDQDSYPSGDNSEDISGQMKETEKGTTEESPKTEVNSAFEGQINNTNEQPVDNADITKEIEQVIEEKVEELSNKAKN